MSTNVLFQTREDDAWLRAHVHVESSQLPVMLMLWMVGVHMDSHGFLGCDTLQPGVLLMILLCIQFDLHLGYGMDGMVRH